MNTKPIPASAPNSRYLLLFKLYEKGKITYDEFMDLLLQDEVKHE